MSIEELKPYPFCGATYVGVSQGKCYCYNCGAEINTGDTELSCGL